MGLHRRTFYNHRVRAVLHTGEVVIGRMHESRRDFLQVRLDNGVIRKLRYRDIRTMGPVGVAVAEKGSKP